MTDEPKLTGDPAVLKELFREWGEWSQRHVDYSDLLFKSALEFNKQVAAFHERLLLISLGTIGLSVTALTAFIPKISSTPYPKHIFIVLIAPAWILLMTSSIGSVIVLGNTLLMNRALFVDMQAVANTTLFRQGAGQLRKFSKELAGTFASPTDSKVYDAKERFSNLANDLDRIASMSEDAKKDSVAKMASVNPLIVAKIGRIAMISFQLGLILLGTSALRLFLSF